ncbi:hypothetical protein SAMN02745170_01790 [Propionispora hippei DSM 15287]|uniref:Uncharacterized protein n=2 Tax=Propionispora TaxID=112902 RepID=A0A1M6GQU9_9FIRM|nr:hypothetical protein SAMN02745170_01790 [Propionispora hippei DSM 15287]
MDSAIQIINGINWGQFKDLFLTLAAFLSPILALYGVKFTQTNQRMIEKSKLDTEQAKMDIQKKKSYNDFVTSERMKWIHKLREQFADFSAACNEYHLYIRFIKGPEIGLNNTDIEKIKKIQWMASYIQFSLNPNEEKDQLHKDVLKTIRNILDLMEYSHPDNDGYNENFTNHLFSFNEIAAKILKEEWETVKKEMNA